MFLWGLVGQLIHSIPKSLDLKACTTQQHPANSHTHIQPSGVSSKPDAGNRH